MIFIPNKYTRLYYRIISNAQSRTLPENTYSEKHHIIPKSLGGDNSKANLVNLTAREHFICHWLLTKMTDGISRQKMANACNILMHCRSGNQQRKINSKVYSTLKANLSMIRRGRKNHKVSIALTGKTLTAEHRLNVSKGRKGQQLSEQSLRKLRKRWEITTPDNQSLCTDNLGGYCLDNNLSVPAMRDNVSKGKQDNHKGYKIKSIP